MSNVVKKREGFVVWILATIGAAVHGERLASKWNNWRPGPTEIKTQHTASNVYSCLCAFSKKAKARYVTNTYFCCHQKLAKEKLALLKTTKSMDWVRCTGGYGWIPNLFPLSEIEVSGERRSSRAQDMDTSKWGRNFCFFFTKRVCLAIDQTEGRSVYKKVQVGFQPLRTVAVFFSVRGIFNNPPVHQKNETPRAERSETEYDPTLHKDSSAHLLPPPRQLPPREPSPSLASPSPPPELELP